MQPPERLRVLPLKSMGQVNAAGRYRLGVGLLKGDLVPAALLYGHRAVRGLGKRKGSFRAFPAVVALRGNENAQSKILIGYADIGAAKGAGSGVIVIQGIEVGFGIADIGLLTVHVQFIVDGAGNLLPPEHHLHGSGSGVTHAEIQPGVMIPGADADGGAVGIKQQIRRHIGVVQQPHHLERNGFPICRFLKLQTQTELGILIVPAKALGQINLIRRSDRGIAHSKGDPMGSVRVILHRALSFSQAGECVGSCGKPEDPLRKQRAEQHDTKEERTDSFEKMFSHTITFLLYIRCLRMP